MRRLAFALFLLAYVLGSWWGLAWILDREDPPPSSPRRTRGPQ